MHVMEIMTKWSRREREAGKRGRVHGREEGCGNVGKCHGEPEGE